MADRSVSIRLGTTGKADVTRAFDDMAASGEASAKRYTVAFDRASADVTAAVQRQASAAAKIAAITPQSSTQMRINDRNSTGFGEYEGSAKRSAAAFRELIAAEEQLEARTRALVASIDPAFVAQQRFNAEIGEARSLVSAGAISLDQYCVKLRQEQALLDASTNAHDRTAVAVRRNGSAMAAIAPQAQDAFTQVSMGTNVLSVLAIQGGQAASQMIYLGGTAEKFGTFMMGPWGLALTGGLLLLGALTKGMGESGDAADKKKASVKSLTDSINDLNEATGRQIKGEQAVQAETLRTAGTLRQQALDARTATVEKLKLARANLSAALVTESNPGGTLPGMGIIGRGVETRRAELTAIDALLKKSEADVAKANVTFRQAEVPIMQRRVAEAFDKSAAATGRYERAVNDLNDRYAKNKIGYTVYAAELGKLTAIRDRDVEAAGKSRSASTALADADARAASASTEVQKAQANLAQVRARGREELRAGTITQAQYTARVAEAERAVNGARESTKDHTKAVRDAAAAQKDLASDLDEVVRRFDPTRAAAEQYAQTLAKIAALRSAGKLTVADAGLYSMRAGTEEAERAAKVRVETIRKLFGIEGDPLAEVISGYENEQQQRIDAITEASERGQQQQEEGAQRLSGLYQSLFSGGTKSIWQEFEQRGRQVLADLLARWTLGKLGGAGSAGGILKLLGLGGSGGLSGGITGPANLDGLLTPSSPLISLPKLASGTENWSGGMALLGEGGMEAAYLPRGTRVSSAAETRRMFDGGGTGGAAFTFDLRGAVVTQDLLAQMNAIGDSAAARGAIGGATMMKADTNRATRRSLIR